MCSLLFSKLNNIRSFYDSSEVFVILLYPSYAFPITSPNLYVPGDEPIVYLQFFFYLNFSSGFTLQWDYL